LHDGRLKSEGFPGATYRWQWAESPMGPWNDVPGDVTLPADGMELDHLPDLPAGVERRVWRLRLVDDGIG
jgi:hypothetical protein